MNYQEAKKILKEKFKEDFLRVSNGYEFEEFKKRHKGENVKFSDFDEEMRIHMNNLIKTKPENPNIHTDVYKNTEK